MKTTDAQRRLLDVIREHGGADGGAEYWPAVNDWVRDRGPAAALAFRNQNRTVAALVRDGFVTIDEDGYFHLTDKGAAVRRRRTAPHFWGFVLVAVLFAHGAAAAQQPERFVPPPQQAPERPRPPMREPLPIDAPSTWTCQQWRFLDSRTLGGWLGWFVGQSEMIEYGYQLTELMRIGGRFIDPAIAPDVRSGLQLLVDGTLSHDVAMWTAGERRMWRACYEYERDAVRRDEADRILRRGKYACVGCLYWNSK